MVEPASWSSAWLPAAPGRCSFSRCSPVASATGAHPSARDRHRGRRVEGQPRPVSELVDLGDTDGRTAEALLYQSLRSDVPELRTASVTALGNLAERHDWAIDGLVEALAEASENPVRVAGELDRLAPRPGPRLPPLLGPSERRRPLLRRAPALALSRARRAARPCLYRRTRRRTSAAPRSRRFERPARPRRSVMRSGSSRTRIRRCAHRRAEPRRPSPAARPRPTSSRSSPTRRGGCARPRARRSSRPATTRLTAVEPALDSDDQALRSGAALVLQDIGHVDSLVGDDEARTAASGSSTRAADGCAAPPPSAPGEGCVLGDGSALEAEAPRDARDRAPRRRPDVRRLPRVAVAHALGAAGRRARGDAPPSARARGRRRRRALRLPVRARRQRPRARVQRERRSRRTRFARCSRSTTRSSR